MTGDKQQEVKNFATEPGWASELYKKPMRT